MMLCEDTMGSYLPVVMGNSSTSPRTNEPPAKDQDRTRPRAEMAIPKNKNAKRRLIATVRENIDRYKRGTEFKNNGRPLPNDLALSIRKIR